MEKSRSGCISHNPYQAHIHNTLTTALQTTKLQEASHLPLSKTHYLSSFGAMVMGAGWDDATANEADVNLRRTVMNGGVINRH